MFTSKDLFRNQLRVLVIKIYRWLFRSSRTRIIVQNQDDLEFVRGEILVYAARTFLIRGSGVDPAKFPRAPLRSPQAAPIIDFFVTIPLLGMRPKGF